MSSQEIEPKHRVFISYSSKDCVFADKIRKALDGKKLKCWVDKEEISPGEDFADSIAEAIESVEAVVVVFSKHTNKSRHVKAEVRAAFDKQKTIVPVLIDHSVPERGFDHLLGNSHWLLIKNETEIPKKLDNLLQLIEIAQDNVVPRRQLRIQSNFLGCTTSLAIAVSLAVGLFMGFLYRPADLRLTKLENDLQSEKEKSATLKLEVETVEMALLTAEEKSADKEHLTAELNQSKKKLDELEGNLQIATAEVEKKSAASIRSENAATLALGRVEYLTKKAEFLTKKNSELESQIKEKSLEVAQARKDQTRLQTERLRQELLAMVESADQRKSTSSPASAAMSTRTNVKKKSKLLVTYSGSDGVNIRDSRSINTSNLYGTIFQQTELPLIQLEETVIEDGKEWVKLEVKGWITCKSSSKKFLTEVGEKRWEVSWNRRGNAFVSMRTGISSKNPLISKVAYGTVLQELDSKQVGDDEYILAKFTGWVIKKSGYREYLRKIE